MNNSQFLEWAIINVACDPNFLNTYYHMFILRLLNDKTYKAGHYAELMDRKGVMNQFYQRTEVKNFWEKVRCGIITTDKEDFLEYAKMFE